MPQTGKYSAADLQTTAPAQTGQYTADDIAPSATQREIAELDLPGTHKALHEKPMMGYPVPVPGAVSGAVAKLIAPSETIIPGGMGFGGAAATTELGPSALSALASKATQSLGTLASKYGIKALGTGAGGAVAYELYHELKKIFE